MRKPTFKVALCILVTMLSVALLAGCLPKPPAETGDVNVVVYGFSIMKESLENAIYPGFAAQWKQSHGQEAVHVLLRRIRNDHQSNPAGVNADIAILSIERDVFRLKMVGSLTPIGGHPS